MMEVPLVLTILRSLTDMKKPSKSSKAELLKEALKAMNNSQEV